MKPRHLSSGGPRWSAKDRRVCKSKSGVKKIKSNLLSAIPGKSALHLDSDPSEGEDSIAEGDNMVIIHFKGLS